MRTATLEQSVTGLQTLDLSRSSYSRWKRFYSRSEITTNAVWMYYTRTILALKNDQWRSQRYSLLTFTW